jgi:hypothetical protein
MKCISKSSVPKGGNVLKSSVICKWKNQETLKARIVPYGSGDSQRHFLRTDSPTMPLDAFRRMMPIEAKKGGYSGLWISKQHISKQKTSTERYMSPPFEKKMKMTLFGD